MESGDNRLWFCYNSTRRHILVDDLLSVYCNDIRHLIKDHLELTTIPSGNTGAEKKV